VSPRPAAATSQPPIRPRDFVFRRAGEQRQFQRPHIGNRPANPLFHHITLIQIRLTRDHESLTSRRSILPNLPPKPATAQSGAPKRAKFREK
jgi:hypothetical protein